MQKWIDEHPTQTLGWQPTCGCNADCQLRRTGKILDTFAGSGTTLAVAQATLSGTQVMLGLHKMNPEYLAIAQRYINRADGITLSMGL